MNLGYYLIFTIVKKIIFCKNLNSLFNPSSQSYDKFILPFNLTNLFKEKGNKSDKESLEKFIENLVKTGEENYYE